MSDPSTRDREKAEELARPHDQRCWIRTLCGSDTPCSCGRPREIERIAAALAEVRAERDAEWVRAYWGDALVDGGAWVAAVFDTPEALARYRREFRRS